MRRFAVFFVPSVLLVLPARSADWKAIEPMLAMVDGASVQRDADGHPLGVATRVAADGWTVEALSGLGSAHFEHTIAVTSSGARVLTRLAEGPR